MLPVSKLLYSATMSLDGFIAGEGGDMSWLKRHLGRPSPEIDDLVSRIGALLIGNRTFTGDDPNKGTDKEGPFGGQWQGPSIVLTREPPGASEASQTAQATDPDVTYATDLQTGVEMAKDAAAGRYVNVLGANVAAQWFRVAR